MTHVAIALLVTTVLLSPRVALAQTLDELQHPLLAKGEVTVHADYGQFSFESAVAGVGFQPSTYFEPPYHILLPTISVGISRKVQFNVSGTYLFPVLRSYATFPDSGSSIDSHWLVKSLQAEVVVRPSDQMEIGVAYLTGRSRYDSAFPRGNGTTVVDTFTTDALQVRGVWLPQPDRESRPLRADLDGLTGQLLRRHRAKIEWDVLWRRYGSTDYETDPLEAGGYLSDSVRSSDTRVRVGAGYGAAERLQVTSDVYWHPPFTVADPIFVHDVFSGDRVDDESRRLSDVFGWRVNARWRPADRLEAVAETTYEHQSVLNGSATPSPWSDNFRQLRVSTGATWLSRSPVAGALLEADLSGLYRPLLERNQLRLDAVLHLLRDHTNDVPTDEKLWRVGATLGVRSFLQANVYAGRFDLGDRLLENGTSFGAGVRIRPTRRIEAYGTLNYHPLTSLGRYPGFILAQGSFARSYQDFTDTTYEDDASIHIGVRLVL